jgi:hypothetical protein
MYGGKTAMRKMVKTALATSRHGGLVLCQKLIDTISAENQNLIINPNPKKPIQYWSTFFFMLLPRV